ncbi:MAG: hypothetical protein K2X95_10460 [Flavobacteriaceae bacterium]|nr:hypothetical protein [Flavobacteriaceae bacterium]
MKKTTQNLIVNFKSNLISSQQLLSLTIKKVLFTIVFSFSFATISAQNGNSVTPAVMEVNAYVSSLKLIEKNSSSSFSNAQNVEDLVYKLQSSVYFNSGIIKTFGENPRNLYTDIASLNGISGASLMKSDIEIVIIKINNTNDLNSNIDLSLFSAFHKLKYIYIVSSVNTTEQNIAKIFRNYDEQYSLFYKINLGE